MVVTSYQYQAAEKDRDSTERLSRQGIHCQGAVVEALSRQPDTDNRERKEMYYYFLVNIGNSTQKGVWKTHNHTLSQGIDAMYITACKAKKLLGVTDSMMINDGLNLIEGES